jgi:L-seryl-tRNA(Ser) seleniumtransferase
VEVGTTNRTYAADYRKAARKGDILLKVHKSNYSMEGFVHEATYAELAEVAGEKGCHAVYDLGSGAVFDYRSAGIGSDDRIDEVLGAGVACVTMSGDKLLGGMQAGLIVGRARFLERLRSNPLRRAVRVDKLTIAGLQEVLRSYLFGPDASAAIPLLGQVLGEAGAVQARAKSVAESLSPAVRRAFDIDVVDDEAAVGGGSWSSAAVSSYAIRIRCASGSDAVALAKTMRLNVPPVISRLKDNEIRINMRSVMPYEDDELRAALEQTLSGAVPRFSG